MWVRQSIREIAEDPVLRVYGALLAATHLFTFWFWHGSLDLATVLGPDAEPICWPFWESCWKYRFHDMAPLRMLLWTYFALAFVPVVLFMRRRWTAAAWWSLLLLNVVKLAIVAQDFQLRMNQHYMAGLASVAFLFLPAKRDGLRMLVALFYFWAGLLKVNYEWLSGSALEAPIWFFRGWLLPVACTYVVLLEVVLVWGIFSRRRWLFWVTLGQLTLFQIVSWHRVGFYYPMVMFALLAIYPLARMRPRLAPATALPLHFMRGDAPRSTAAFLAGMCLLQCVPLLYPGESALTGEGRMFAIHMFDAAVQCESYVVLKRPDGALERRDFSRPLPVRIRCDPIVFLNKAQALCRSAERGKDFVDFDLHVDARKATESVMRPLIALQNVCATDPTYDVWRHNWWINPRARR
jgi:hypothetical protein